MVRILGFLWQALRRASGEGEAHPCDPGAIEVAGSTVDVQTLLHNDEKHVLVHAVAECHCWCKVGIRVILPPEGQAEIQSSFGIDLINYAVEEDFVLQTRVLETAIDVMSQHLPSLDAGATLRAQLEISFNRIRQCLVKNAAAGYSHTEFSIYEAFQPQLALATPSTAIGSSRVIGALFSEVTAKFGGIEHGHTKFLHPSRRCSLTQTSDPSGHSRAWAHADRKGEHLKNARTCFDRERYLGPHVNDRCLGFPGTGVTAWQRPTTNPNNWHGGAKFSNGDIIEVCLAEGLADVARSYRVEAQLNIRLRWYYDAKRFQVIGGDCVNNRFTSMDALNQTFRIFFERIVMLDPVWPKWLLAEAWAVFDPGHPALLELNVPKRHQPMFATVLEHCYDELRKTTRDGQGNQQKLR